VIGATVTHRRATQAFARMHADLGELLRRFASVQIRNAGRSAATSQRLARSATCRRPDRPGRRLSCAAGRTPRASRWRISSSPTASRTAPGRIRRVGFVPKAFARAVFGCYKLSKTVRPGHFGRDGGFSADLGRGVITEARLAFGGMAAIPEAGERR
jgi:xanthine dehydrogenase small subunit